MKQLELPVAARWGGKRRGAGRKPLRGKRVSHGRRARHAGWKPVHVTMRARRGIGSLRTGLLYAAVVRALSRGSKSWFRIVQFSVQTDHLHLVVEANGTLALMRGMQGLGVRTARAINRAAGRSGTVWDDRYHGHLLSSPREMRTALVYVLLNFRKHLGAGPGIDPCSSGRWFDGWAHAPPPSKDPLPVLPARTWLAAIGWRKVGGAIDVREHPAGATAPSADATAHAPVAA